MQKLPDLDLHELHAFCKEMYACFKQTVEADGFSPPNDGFELYVRGFATDDEQPEFRAKMIYNSGERVKVSDEQYEHHMMTKSVGVDARDINVLYELVDTFRGVTISIRAAFWLAHPTEYKLALIQAGAIKTYLAEPQPTQYISCGV